ncbi:MAG: hypothetical protein JWM09_866 [Francisellaceae bacterium]|nr:hypothetical protein [Francisellaceae bacterium]
MSKQIPVIDAEVKLKLAQAYRILSLWGLDDATYTHLSARPPNAPYYYIYPFGLLFEEVTPFNLLKVSLEGKILEGEEYQYNQTGYVIHGSIYRNRGDLNAIFHLHTVAGVAVSCTKKGLLPISQWALHFYKKIAYHPYQCLALNTDDHELQLIKDLSNYKVMFMQNHGTLTCGKTVPEALYYCYHLEKACQTQIAALSMNQDLCILSETVACKTNEQLLNFEENLGERDWLAWVRKIQF